MVSDRFHFIFFAFVLFMGTLRSFLFSGLPLFSLAAFLLCIGYVLAKMDKMSVTKNQFRIIICNLIFFIFLVSSTLLFKIDMDPKRILGVLIVFTTLIISPLLVKYFTSEIFKIVLAAHLCFYYLQLFSYYFFGVYLDFLFLSENSSRNFGGVFIVPFFGVPLMRASGLFSEPGNYANFIFLLYVGHFITRRSEADLIRGKFLTGFLFSLVTTFSAFGLIFALCVIANRIKSIKSLIVPATIFALVVAPYFVDRFVTKESGRESSGIEFRLLYVEDALSNFESVRGIIVGKGGMSAPSFFKEEGGSDNDSGLLVFVFREFGPVLTLMLLIPAAFVQFRHGFSLLVCVSLFTKITPLSFFTPLFYTIILCRFGKQRVNDQQDRRLA